jgi:O-antigen ligase
MIIPTVLLAILLSFMPSIFFTRFQEAGNNGGSGRTDIWKVGWVAFKHYGFLGAGFNNFPFAYAKYAGEAPRYRGTYRDPHNIYVAIGVETGIIGLFLFGGVVVSQLRPAFRLKDQFGNHNLLPATEAGFWGLLIFGFSGNILWEKAFWLAMMLLTIAVNTAQDRQYSLTPQG